jgi:hypothetical protein
MILHDHNSESRPDRVSPKKVVTSIVALFVTVFSMIAALNIYPQLRWAYGEDVADLVLVYGGFALFLLWIETPVDVSLDEPGTPADDEF